MTKSISSGDTRASDSSLAHNARWSRLGEAYAKSRSPLNTPLAVERGLASLGVFCACASVVFAGYMLESRGDAVRLNGLAHLGIFAMPKSRPDALKAVPIGGASVASRPDAVDMSPTGAIAKASGDNIPGPEAPRAPRYTVVSIAGQRAWLRSESGFVQYGVGDYAPGLGRITAIEGAGNRGRVVTSGGALLATGNDDAGRTDPKGRLFDARPMIFDERQAP